MQTQKDVDEFGKQFFYFCKGGEIEKGVQFAKYIRNIHEGKGIQLLFYELVYQLSNIDLKITQNLLEDIPSFASWKDMKKIAQYVYAKTSKTTHPVILHIIWIINRQIMNECRGMGANEMSNVAKWIPREKSCFWLFYALAYDWACNYDKNMSKWVLQSQPISKKIENKICMVYRKIIGGLNRKINTVEIDLCERKYSRICPENVALHSFHKYKRLFLDYYQLNEEASGEAASSKSSFVKMTYEFKIHLHNLFLKSSVGEGESILKDPVGVRLGSLVKEAVGLLDKQVKSHYSECIYSNLWGSLLDTGMRITKNGGVSPDKPAIQETHDKKMDVLFSEFMNMEYRIDILNRQWAFFMRQCSSLENFIPFLDVSLDMCCGNRQNLFDAIGIACTISNRSTIPNRIMTIDHNPNWIVLPDQDNIAGNEFVSIVKLIMQSFSGNTTANLHKSMDLLALSFLKGNTEPHDILNTTIVIISNFVGLKKYEDIHEMVYGIFQARGLNVVPHIVYWNVGGGMDIVIPCGSGVVGASLQSGHSLTDVCHLSYIDRTDNVLKNVENIVSVF